MAIAEKEVQLPRMTFEEFLKWNSDEFRAEWVDGEVQFLMPVSLAHALICKFLTKILENFIEQRNLGILLFAPFLMKLSIRPSGREPDILFVARSNQHNLKETYLDGPADIAIEIVSPESRDRDRIEKFREYARAGVREYWLIDPSLKEANFFVLNAGVYEPAKIDSEGRFWSNVLTGFWLDVNWVWDMPTLAFVQEAWETALIPQGITASQKEEDTK